MAIEKWLLGFGLWRFLGDLQRGVERAADAEDAFGDELARQDAHTRQVLDLLDRMDAVSDQPERLEQLECELRELDIEAYWDYQQAVLAAQPSEPISAEEFAERLRTWMHGFPGEDSASIGVMIEPGVRVTPQDPACPE